MWVLLCINCQDAVGIRHTTRSCECGSCSARKVVQQKGEKPTLVVTGEDARVLTLDDSDLAEVLIAQERDGDIAWKRGRYPPGRRFDAFVAAESSYERVKK